MPNGWGILPFSKSNLTTITRVGQWGVTLITALVLLMTFDESCLKINHMTALNPVVHTYRGNFGKCAFLGGIPPGCQLEQALKDARVPKDI